MYSAVPFQCVNQLHSDKIALLGPQEKRMAYKKQQIAYKKAWRKQLAELESALHVGLSPAAGNVVSVSPPYNFSRSSVASERLSGDSSTTNSTNRKATGD